MVEFGLITNRYGERLVDRFWKSVDKKGEDECWIWKSSLINGRYGSFRFITINTSAHRIAYELTHGRIIEKDTYVLHKCDNRLCCNPKHLFLGTQQDNMNDMIKKGRSVKCSHPNNKYGSKITIKDKRMICLLYKNKIATQKELAFKFDLSESRISYIVNGK